MKRQKKHKYVLVIRDVKKQTVRQILGFINLEDLIAICLAEKKRNPRGQFMVFDKGERAAFKALVPDFVCEGSAK